MLLGSCLLAYLLPVQKLRGPNVEDQRGSEPAGAIQAGATGQRKVPAGEEERSSSGEERNNAAPEAHCDRDEAGVVDEDGAAQSQDEQPQQLDQVGAMHARYVASQAQRQWNRPLAAVFLLVDIANCGCSCQLKQCFHA